MYFICGQFCSAPRLWLSGLQQPLLSAALHLCSGGSSLPSKHPWTDALLWSLSSLTLHSPTGLLSSSFLLSSLSLSVSGRTSMLCGQLRGPPLGGNSLLHIIPRVLQQKMRQNASVVPRYPSLPFFLFPMLPPSPPPPPPPLPFPSLSSFPWWCKSRHGSWHSCISCFFEKIAWFVFQS